jgi:hypothetical protein
MAFFYHFKVISGGRIREFRKSICFLQIEFRKFSDGYSSLRLITGHSESYLFNRGTATVA